MADESAETVGGISVGVGIDDSKVDTELDALLARLTARAERAQIGIPVNVVGGAPGGRQPRAAQPQQPAVRLVGAGGSGGRSKLDLEDLAPQYQQQLAQAMQVQAAGATRTAATAIQRSTSSAVDDLSQQVAAEPIEIKLDTSELKAQFEALIAELRQMAGQASEAATITPRVAVTRTPRLSRAAMQDDHQLRELSYEAQTASQSGATPQSATFAPQRTPAQIAAGRREQARLADQERQRRGADYGRITPPPPIENAASEAYLSPDERPGGRTGRGRGGAMARTEADVQRSQEERLARAEAQAVSAGRTSRTQASALGGFLGGRRELIRAESDLAAASEKVRIAQRRVNDPAIIANTRAHRHAVEELAVAETERVTALQKVESFSGFAAGARNLLAVTAAGAAFGLGLKAIDTGLELAGKAVDPLVSRFLGFSNVAGRVTDDLSTQTKAAMGNVRAVTALAEAQAGLSASSAALINPLIEQRTQIEAGNKSIKEQVDLFQTYQNLRAQGAGGGLTQETGGILGMGLFGTRSTAQELGRLFQGFPQTTPTGTGSPLAQGAQQAAAANPYLFSGTAGLRDRFVTTETQAITNLDIFNTGLAFANGQLVKGGESTLKFVKANQQAVDQAVAAAQAANLPSEFTDGLRSAGIGIEGLSNDLDTAAEQITRILAAFNTGAQRPDPQLLRQQQDQQRRATINAVGRELKFALGAQIPAQRALEGLTQPLAPIGTGIKAANPEEQARINAAEKETISLQTKLNAGYEQGRKVLETTFRASLVKNFGEATAQAFDKAVAGLEAVSDRIVDIQSGISNKQAAYQTAQYNYQLQIAKRTLSDINALNDQNLRGAGQSYLGQLQKENLELGRQGQQLQFNLAQRQINFQVAIAGFEAPGITPAERQARVKQAQIEADFAQKQLNIQQEMFGNQVEIVDLSNLRQGVDLANQIGLLLQGRAVTIDTQVAQEQLERLQRTQAQLVTEVGTYTSAVTTLAGQAMTEIAQLEAAAGEALGGVAEDVLRQYGLVIDGINAQLSGGPQTGTGTGTGGGRPALKLAGGDVFTTNGPTSMTVGEAGTETVAVLRNPRQFMGDMGGGGGGTVIMDIHDNPVRSDEDLDNLARRIEAMLGRKASTLGLRSVG